MSIWWCRYRQRGYRRFLTAAHPDPSNLSAAGLFNEKEGARGSDGTGGLSSDQFWASEARSKSTLLNTAALIDVKM